MIDKKTALAILVIFGFLYIGVFDTGTIYTRGECSPFYLTAGDSYYGIEIDARYLFNENNVDYEIHTAFLTEEEAFFYLRDTLDSKDWNGDPDYAIAICEVTGNKPSRCANNYATCSPLSYNELEKKYIIEEQQIEDKIVEEDMIDLEDIQEEQQTTDTESQSSISLIQKINDWFDNLLSWLLR